MLNKKNKVLFVCIVMISIISISTVYVNVYAASYNNLPDKEVIAEMDGNIRTDIGPIGSLKAPADESAEGGIEIKLDGSPIQFQLAEYKYDNDGSTIVKRYADSLQEITPFKTITWSDQTISYNTRMRFTRSGDTFIIRKGVTAIFSFKIKYQNSHFEAGFMDKDFNVLEVFSDRNGAGGSYPFTPDKDVEGYFYIWNKSADAIEVEEISLNY